MTEEVFVDRDSIQRRATDCREAVAEASRTIQALEARALRALENADIRTAEQRARAERAEDALRTLRAKPGEPVVWSCPAIAAKVVSDERWTDLRVVAGFSSFAPQVFGRLGEAGDAAIVGLQPRAATPGSRDVRVELWLDLKPGGTLDRLADVVGKLIQARDAAAVSAQVSTASVEVDVRPIAGSAP